MKYSHYPSVDAVTIATFPSNRLHFIEEDALALNFWTLWLIVERDIVINVERIRLAMCNIMSR